MLTYQDLPPEPTLPKQASTEQLKEHNRQQRERYKMLQHIVEAKLQFEKSLEVTGVSHTYSQYVNEALYRLRPSKVEQVLQASGISMIDFKRTLLAQVTQESTLTPRNTSKGPYGTYIGQAQISLDLFDSEYVSNAQQDRFMLDRAGKSYTNTGLSLNLLTPKLQRVDKAALPSQFDKGPYDGTYGRVATPYRITIAPHEKIKGRKEVTSGAYINIHPEDQFQIHMMHMLAMIKAAKGSPYTLEGALYGWSTGKGAFRAWLANKANRPPSAYAREVLARREKIRPVKK